MKSRFLKIILFAAGITSSAAAKENCNYQDLPGEIATFREMDQSIQKYGYQGWNTKPDIFGKLDYRSYVGKKGKLQPDLYHESRFNTDFKVMVLENCQTLYARYANGELLVGGIYTQSDVEEANKLIGGHIWIDQTNVLRPQTLATLNKSVSFSLKHMEKVEVVQIYLPTIGHAFGSGPFSLLVRKETGEEGYIAYSSRYFFTSDPFPKNLPENIKEAILNQQVILGMTSQQVQLSWGKPNKVNKSVGSWGTKEQWIYPNRYLYLENGKLTSYQTSD